MTTMLASEHSFSLSVWLLLTSAEVVYIGAVRLPRRSFCILEENLCRRRDDLSSKDSVVVFDEYIIVVVVDVDGKDDHTNIQFNHSYQKST